MAAKVVFGSVGAADQSHEPARARAGKSSNDGQRNSVSLSVSYSTSPQRPSSFGGASYSYGSTSTDPRTSVTSSPRLPRSDSGTLLNVVPEDRIMMEFPSSEHTRTPIYTGGVPIHDGDDEPDSEEEEWELDEELEEHGLYRGSYRRLMLLYTLTPLTFLVFFAALAALPSIVFPISEPWPYPSAPYLPHPIPELLTSAALFSLAHLLHEPLTTLTASLPPSSASPLATALHTLLSLLLHQSALPLLLVAHHAPARPITHDAAFRRVWWLALGWAAAEAVAAVAQGYAARALYRDVFVSVRRIDHAGRGGEDVDVEAEAEAGGGRGGQKVETRALGPINGSGAGAGSRSTREGHGQELSTVEMFEREVFSEEDADELEPVGERQPLLRRATRDAQNGSAIKMQVEDELEALLVMRAREELEEAYGVPIIRVPVFLSCLQRINALLLTLGIYLLLSQAYLRSTLATPISPSPASPSPSPSLSFFTPFLQNPDRSNLPLFLALPFCLLVQCGLALLQTPPLLPRVGAPAAVYSASLVSLGVFFAGLAVWEGLS